MHGVWEKILDEDFVHAYKYGIVIKCIDGIERRIYPQFFIYSADVVHKSVLLKSWSQVLYLEGKGILFFTCIYFYNDFYPYKVKLPCLKV